MAVNRVDFGGNTLIDLTGDTLESAEQLLKGIIAHAKDGSVITGLMEAGGGAPESGEWACGTYTPAETITIGTSKYITIETGLKEIRFFGFIFNHAHTSGTAHEYMMAIWDYNGGDYYGYRLAHSNSNSISSLRAGATVNNEYVGDTLYADGGTMYIQGVTTSTVVVSGNMYVWFAIGR